MRRVAVLSLLIGFNALAAEKPNVVELLDDATSDAVMRQLTNDGALDATQMRREYRDVFSGSHSTFVSPFQRFSSRIAGWNHAIVEKPAPGQYRYIRFAWKRLGSEGVMIQFHNALTGSWNQRYLAGKNTATTVAWGAILPIAERNPEEWTVVTRDLFKDFGAFNITGFALTPMEGGTGGLFDHFMLGRTIEDLDAATAAAFGRTPLKDDLTKERLAQLWRDLADRDGIGASEAMRALTAARKQSIPFLVEQVGKAVDPLDEKNIAALIEALDDNRFRVREKAYRELDQLGDRALPWLEKANKETTSAEVKRRVGELLKKHAGGEQVIPAAHLQVLRTIRILEWSATAEAREALKKLSKQSLPGGLAKDAARALERIAKRL